MKPKKYLIIAITFLIFVIICVQVTQVAGKSEQKANTTPRVKSVTEKREILAGLQGVEVVVADFRPEDEQYGFNKQQYKTDVELRLRQYGVKVLSNEERSKTEGCPCLYINVNPIITEHRGGVAAVSVLIQLQEMVLLLRNGKFIATDAYTWNKGYTQIVDLDSLNVIRDKVKDLVDMFINDYLAANPKEQPAKEPKKPLDLRTVEENNNNSKDD